MDELDTWMDMMDPWVGLEEGLFGKSAEEVRQTDQAQVQALIEAREERDRNARAANTSTTTMGGPDFDVADSAAELPSKRKRGSFTTNPADVLATPKKARHSFRQAFLHEEKTYGHGTSRTMQPQLSAKPKVKIQSNRNPFTLDASPHDASAIKLNASGL
ncbi:hypothetical protein FRC09_019314 [Ceratobasidium sp. 395]|nr:hypothetical protein FRC09_019314 [Ceratobasidium sp. 395]